MPQEIWIFGEHRDLEFHPVVTELLAEAAKIASNMGAEVGAVVAVNGEVPDPSLLEDYGAQRIYLVQYDNPDRFDSEIHVDLLTEVVRRYEPDLLLVGETPLGSEVARRVAIRLGASFVPNYTQIRAANDRFSVKKPVYGGKLGAGVVTLCRPMVATISPGATGVAGKVRRQGPAKVKEVRVGAASNQKRVEVLEHVPADPDTIDLSEADIVIGGGQGLGSETGFALLHELARALGGSVGGTRRARDQGFIDLERQIGQTGKIISPKCYIAVGISGASHHIVGIRDSKLIISINTDRNAPIVALSDLTVVCDAEQMLPALIGRILQLKENTEDS